MSIGYWTGQAQAGLGEAAALLGGPAGPHVDDVVGVVLARRDVYRGLARLVDLLTGARPGAAGLGLAAAEAMMRRPGNDVARLRVGLRAAILHDGVYPPAAPPRAPVEQAMRRTADAVGVIGDILASHVQPGRQPRTAEGAAIRAGGGVPAALADVARLAGGLLAVDARLPDWLGRAEAPGVARFAAVAAAARWACGGPLRSAADQVVQAGAGAEALLRLLEAAPVLGEAAAAVTTAEDAVAALVSARTWLWQHPGQVQFAHLRLGTQLGLAAHTVLGGPAAGEATAQSRARAWRAAAVAVAGLHGAPTVSAGRAAERELAEVLRWTRAQDRGQPVGRHAERVARLGGELPLLAEALGRGVAGAVRRGELFCGEPQLHKPQGKPLFYARTVWRPITGPDAATRALSAALRRLRPTNHVNVLESLPLRARQRSAQAFPGPPRTTTKPSTPTGNPPYADGPRPAPGWTNLRGR